MDLIKDLVTVISWALNGSSNKNFILEGVFRQKVFAQAYPKNR
jgi:hypothetical protein